MAGCIFYLPNDSQWPAYEATSLKPARAIYLDAEYKDIPEPSCTITEGEQLASKLEPQRPLGDGRGGRDNQKQLQTSIEQLNKSGMSKKVTQPDQSPGSVNAVAERVLVEIPQDGVVLKDRDITVSFWFFVPGS